MQGLVVFCCEPSGMRSEQMQSMLLNHKCLRHAKVTVGTIYS